MGSLRSDLCGLSDPDRTRITELEGSLSVPQGWQVGPPQGSASAFALSSVFPARHNKEPLSISMARWLVQAAFGKGHQLNCNSIGPARISRASNWNWCVLICKRTLQDVTRSPRTGETRHLSLNFQTKGWLCIWQIAPRRRWVPEAEREGVSQSVPGRLW